MRSILSLVVVQYCVFALKVGSSSQFEPDPTGWKPIIVTNEINPQAPSSNIITGPSHRVARQAAEVSKECSGKPDAPEHSTVRCFKKYNTCRATCQNGYIFTKKGSKSAIYDCEGGKWVMRDGEDKCQRIDSAATLKSKSEINPSPDHASSNNGSKPGPRNNVRCSIDYGDYNDTDWWYGDYSRDHDIDFGYDEETGGCVSSASYLCNGTKLCMPESRVCDLYVDCPNEDDEAGCDHGGKALIRKSKNDNKISLDQISSDKRRKLRCFPPMYYHEHDCYDYHYHHDIYYYDYYNFYNYDEDHLYDFYHYEYDKIPSVYSCIGTNECILDNYVCDGWKDCPEGDDESNCHGCVFDRKTYSPGNKILNACAILTCNGTTREFTFDGFDSNCPYCVAYLDPHIVTYDQSQSGWNNYVYNKCGNYSLSQITNSYSPSSAVYAEFKLCEISNPYSVTCVDSATFKNDANTIITMGYGSGGYEIQVNGDAFKVPNSSPTIVQVTGTDYPILAWKEWDCVFLQGSTGFLVAFCGNDKNNANLVAVFTKSDFGGQLKGLCGTINNDDFIARNGISFGKWKHDAPDGFVLSWLASPKGNAECGGGNARVKRQTQNRCEADSSVLDAIKTQCENTVTNGLSGIIDACVYDLCRVNDPDEWIKAVQKTVQVQVDVQENTIIIPTTTPNGTTTQVISKNKQVINVNVQVNINQP